jgi:hypothetical protein
LSVNLAPARCHSIVAAYSLIEPPGSFVLSALATR